MTLVARIFHTLSQISIFDLSIRFLLVFIPFSSFISVFFTYRLGIPGASFIKEIVLLIAGVALVYTYARSYMSDKKYTITFTRIDYLIFIYIAVLSIVTLSTTGIRGLIFGGRYDFAFLLSYLIAYHGYRFLARPLSYYLRIFIFSAGFMLCISGLLKWPLHEDILLYFGYSGNPSAWDFGGAPPIFHGIDGANVRRFQWLLDGPNTMWAFLIIYSGIFAYFFRFRPKWYFVISIVLMGLFGMAFYTYSRSALIWLIWAYVLVLVLSLSSLWRLYRMQLISVFFILIMILGSIAVLYSERAMAIVGRSGSTAWHAERMMAGIHRTIDHPLGQWLGSAWPAYRYVNRLSGTNSIEIAELDRYYIPESWYIQQFIEWGYIWGIVFIAIILSMFVSLMMIHPILGAMFAGVGTMNLFLHTFESSVVALSLFLLVWILIAHANHAKK